MATSAIFIDIYARFCIVLWDVYIDEMCTWMGRDTLVAWYGPLRAVAVAADAARGVATPRSAARASRVFSRAHVCGFVR